jgi:long-chain acyl-CoA synthetase
MTDMSLGHLLSERARLTPLKEALVDEGRRYTFEEFNLRVDRLANQLHRAGIRHGQRIALVARNSEMHAATVLAASKLGAIAVVVNWRLAAPELEYILRDSAPSALVYQTEFLPLLDQVSDEAMPSLRICNAGRDGGSYDYETLVNPTAVTDEGAAPYAVTVNPDDPVVIMYTSGTTGRSKGAVLTHQNLYTAAHSSSCTIDWNSKQRFLLGAPMFHIGGLFYLFGNIMRGTTTVMLPNFQPALTWQLIESEHITTMMTVPAMLRAMLDAPELKTVDRSRLEYLICGGSTVSSALINEAATHGLDVQLVYGATEFTGPITFWVQKDDPDGLGSAGRVIMNAELAAFDPESQTRLAANQVGEICLRGPMTFAGYWGNEAATKEALVNGWYRTGDIGSVDAAGRLHLKDRLKDLIISGGENIYPAEIEAALAGHAAVAEVTVVGRPDERWGEVPIAYVVRRAGTNPSAQEIIAYLKERVASYKAVKDVVFIDELPKNAVGKVLRRKLRTG